MRQLRKDLDHELAWGLLGRSDERSLLDYGRISDNPIAYF